MKPTHIHLASRDVYFIDFCAGIRKALEVAGVIVTVSESLQEPNADILIAVGVHLFMDAPLRPRGLLVGIQTEQMSVNGNATGRLLRNERRFQCVAGYYDVLFDWIPGLASKSQRLFLPYGCPETDFREEPKKYDVCFIGNIHGNRREAILKSLQRDFCFFPDFSPGFGEAKQTAILQSRVLLNIKFYESGGMESPRMFDYLSSGAFVISEHSDDTTPFVDGTDFVGYRGEEHLRSLLFRFLHDHDARQKIARHGHATSQNYIWSKVARHLLNELSARRTPRNRTTSLTGWLKSRMKCQLFTAKDALSTLKKKLHQ